MAIEDDVMKVLLALAGYERMPNDPERGHHPLEREGLVKVVGLHGNRLKDVVDLLEARDLIDRKKFVDDNIGYIQLTAQGRREAERVTARRVTQAHAIRKPDGARELPSETKHVFYSWQRDLPNATNRGLIEDALDAALADLKKSDPAAAVDAAPDRDTQGVPGSPDIVSTIFEKIDAAAVFVADVSIVSHRDAERPSPNPNVLVEWGYAMRALGPSRIISVFNTHFGAVETLPFDLRGRRVLTYECDPDVPERAGARRKLTSALKDAIAGCLAEAPPSNSSIAITVTRVTKLHDTTDRSILIKVQNRGAQPLFISAITVEWEPNDGIWTELDLMGRTNTGGRVDPGDAYDWVLPVNVLVDQEQEHERKFEYIAVHDRVGGVHRSKPGDLRRALSE
jgi:DNA-binding MarR family transcriptional regulator